MKKGYKVKIVNLAGFENYIGTYVIEKVITYSEKLTRYKLEGIIYFFEEKNLQLVENVK